MSINWDVSDKNIGVMGDSAVTLEDGKYKVIIADVKDVSSQESRTGNPYMFFQYKVIDHENPNYNGVLINDYFSQKAYEDRWGKEKIKTFLTALKLPFKITDISLFYNKKMIVRIEVEIYNDRKKYSVKHYYPLEAASLASPPPPAPAPAKTSGAVRAAPKSDSPPDDDIPGPPPAKSKPEPQGQKGSYRILGEQAQTEVKTQPSQEAPQPEEEDPGPPPVDDSSYLF
jgi:hypothetical protein